MKEERYRIQFAALLKQSKGVFSYHPADFSGIKGKQADLLVWPAKPVLVEAKVWDRKTISWTLAREVKSRGENSKRQVQWYLQRVKEGYQVFYVVWRQGERQKKRGLPRWIYHLNKRKFVSLKRLIREVNKCREPIAQPRKRSGTCSEKGIRSLKSSNRTRMSTGA